MIDWQRVRELREEIGEDDFAEVVSLFLEEADEVAAKIMALKTPDQIESALHFLKGSALNLGFKEFAVLCQAGEKAASLGKTESVDLASVVAIYEASKQAFAGGKAAEDAA